MDEDFRAGIRADLQALIDHIHQNAAPSAARVIMLSHLDQAAAFSPQLEPRPPEAPAENTK